MTEEVPLWRRSTKTAAAIRAPQEDSPSMAFKSSSSSSRGPIPTGKSAPLQELDDRNIPSGRLNFFSDELTPTSTPPRQMMDPANRSSSSSQGSGKPSGTAYGAIGDGASTRSSRSYEHLSPSTLLEPSTPYFDDQSSPSSPSLWSRGLPVTPKTPDHYQKSAQPVFESGTKHEAFSGTHLSGGKDERPGDVGRYLMIRHIPPQTDAEHVEAMIRRLADYHFIIPKYLRSKGSEILVVFHDYREAAKVYGHLQARPVILSPDDDPVFLQCSKVDRSLVEKESGFRLDFGTGSTVVVEIIGKHVNAENMKMFARSFGDFMHLEETDHGRKFTIDFFDARAAGDMVERVNGLDIQGARILATFRSDDPFAPGLQSRETGQEASVFTLGSAAYHGGIFPRAADRRRSEDYTPSLQRSASHDDNVFSARPSPAVSTFSSARSPYASGQWSGSSTQGGYPSQTPPQSSLYSEQAARFNLPAMHTYRDQLPARYEALQRRARDPAVLQSMLNDVDISARVKQGQGLGRPDDPRDRQRIPEENRVIPERIISGLDGRTTVMVKDVPNKLSRQELVKILNEVVPGEFDFVYLRFDFANCCNVGYAFVNFTNVRSLYEFIQARVGKKWNMFSSEKVLQLSYANIQGKMALINKFKNSAVMTVMEDWRPQIFYSSGALKGQPEPFPDSDNPMLKYRSTQARLNSIQGAGSQAEEATIYDYEYANTVFDRHF